MPRLDDIVRSMHDMDPEELRDFIRGIRSDRKLRKVVKQSKRVVGTKTKTTALSAIQSLSADDLEALMKRYGVEDAEPT